MLVGGVQVQANVTRRICPLKADKCRLKGACSCATVSDTSMVPSEMRPDTPNRSRQVERRHSVVSSLAKALPIPPHSPLPLLDKKGQDKPDYCRLGKSQLACRVARHGARVNSNLLSSSLFVPCLPLSIEGGLVCLFQQADIPVTVRAGRLIL